MLHAGLAVTCYLLVFFSSFLLSIFFFLLYISSHQFSFEGCVSRNLFYVVTPSVGFSDPAIPQSVSPVSGAVLAEEWKLIMKSSLKCFTDVIDLILQNSVASKTFWCWLYMLRMLQNYITVGITFWLWYEGLGGIFMRPLNSALLILQIPLQSKVSCLAN